MRKLWLAATVVVLASCSTAPARSPPITATPSRPFPAQATTAPGPVAVLTPQPNHACAPTRQHLDSDYTPGGLYAPGVADGGPATPVDVSAVREPVPRSEARSRNGNRSPYTVLGKSYRVLDSAKGYRERGVASWYGTKFNGRATSSGELYDMCVFTAAHKTLPLPSFVRVTNLDNGRSLIVRVNDRGPFHSGRIMDLSYAAAVRLGVAQTGTARVQLQALQDEREPLLNAAASGQPVTILARSSDNQRTGDSLVQVGSFSEKSNAKRLADRLRDAKVDDVDLDHAHVDGHDVWRVRVGPVRSDKLLSLLRRLRQLDLPNARVLSE